MKLDSWWGKGRQEGRKVGSEATVMTSGMGSHLRKVWSAESHDLTHIFKVSLQLLF